MSEPKRHEGNVDQDLGTKHTPAQVTPQEDATPEGAKSVVEQDAEASLADVERIPSTEKKSELKAPTATIGQVVHFWVNDPAGTDGRRCHPAMVAMVYDDGTTCNLGVLNIFGANFGQVGIKFSKEPEVGCWSFPKQD